MAKPKKPESKDGYVDFKWRTGRYKSWQANLIYAQLDTQSSSGDILIGQMQTRELALVAVQDHNSLLE